MKPHLARAAATSLNRNCRADRMKVLVHTGTGLWLAARPLASGKFLWSKDASGTLALTRSQFDALVLRLPWQRLREAGVITLP